ncbi:MAG: hypothetical protein WC953_11150 [Pseudomonas sp.]
MANNTAFREIERKLADSLAQLDASKKTERLREAREFADELKTLMKTYRMSSGDVVGILRSSADMP